MAYNFDLSTPILYFNARPPGRSEYRYLLWPAFAYRVLAPKIREISLNLIQKAVLGLCRADRLAAAQIAEALHLNPDLVRLVIAELTAYGYLDPAGRVTDRGNRVLDEMRDDTLSLVVGYVFRDLWSEELWPRFIEQFEYAEIELQESRSLVLNLGTRGRPVRRTPYIVSAGIVPDPSAPSALEILEVSRRHRRALNWFPRQRGSAEPEDEDTEEINFSEPQRFDRINLVFQEPQPCYLVTCLYVPSQDPGSTDWFVCDPFGLGASPQMRGMVERRLAENVGLRNLLDKLLLDAAGNDTPKSGGQQKQDIEGFAESEVNKQLSGNPIDPRLRDLLLDMERAHQEMLYCGPGPRSQLEGLPIKAAKVLERLFTVLQEQTRLTGPLRELPRDDRMYRQAWIQEIAKQLGFTVPLPAILTSQSYARIQQSWEKGGGTLMQRAVVALIAARRDKQHPLWKVAQHAPDLFAWVADANELRKAGAHDLPSTYSDKDLGSRVETIIANTYRAVRASLLDPCLEGSVQ